MRGWVICATLCAALVATPLWAQRGGGAGHGGFGGGGHAGGFAGHAGAVGHAPVAYRGWSGGGWHGNGWSFRLRGYPYRYWGWRGYPWWGWNWGWGGWSYYPWWGWGAGFYDSSYDSYASDAYDGEYPAYYSYLPPSGSSATYASQDEVQRIQNEVEELRARYAQRYSEPRSTPTTLIYRDGHHETVENYAIAGSTLWIFNQDHARKVPLSQIDVPATQRDNESRGGDFVVPNTR